VPTKRSLITAAALAAAVLAGSQTAARAETALSLVYPFPDFLVYTKSCKALVANINKAAAGQVKIDIKPFNSIKMFQQPGAVSKGAVDMVCTPAAFYAQKIPENEAISTSNSSPAIVRKNGGMGVIDDLHRKHFNMTYLGWIDSGLGFYIFTQDPPKFKSDGLPDFAGVKMRDNPIYGAFFRALGATTHNMSSNQVYSALEKGVVNASAWASLGITQLKWDKFLRHRVDPMFYHTDIGMIMNLDAWKGLNAAAQQVIKAEIVKHEVSSRAARIAESKAEEKKLIAEGMKFWPTPAGDKYLQIAIDSAYDRMTGRLKKMKRSLDAAGKLRKLYQEGASDR
jgi:TRAP-type C4-dicarboxylate transport system substrate-binding protein|tara:strand:- start:1063 stop:2079 length:1017 start_codon:yes stop_codon:yes gene_type:complete